MMAHRHVFYYAAKHTVWGTRYVHSFRYDNIEHTRNANKELMDALPTRDGWSGDGIWRCVSCLLHG